MVVISREHTTAPADAPVPSPLEEPSSDEVAAASNPGVYVPGSGPTEVTASRSYVSLRTCDPIGTDYDPVGGCAGPEGWAYVTGSVDSPGVHSGLLGTVDDLVLSALDDRLFVASAASFSQDPPSAPPAWLIDSVTGQRGPLTWQDEPTTLDSAEQVVVLFPAPNPIPWNTDYGEPFLPRVVDRRDWTIRPLRVPEDATGALAIHQPGLGRIWIGTAPDGGDVGLAYSDDGGASWTDVELPPSLRPTSAELVASKQGRPLVGCRGHGGPRRGDERVGRCDRPFFVSADAGETWNTALLDPADGNGRKLFVLSDDRLMVVRTVDFQAIGLRVSSTPSDWSQLEESGDSDEFLGGIRSAVDAYQHGLVVNYVLSGDVEPMVLFSTDLGHGGNGLVDHPRTLREHPMLTIGQGEAARGRTAAADPQIKPNTTIHPEPGSRSWRRTSPPITASDRSGPPMETASLTSASATTCPTTGGVCREGHEVAVVTMSDDDPLEPAGTQAVMPPPETSGPDGITRWYPFSVTWSPDGMTLLYLAWNDRADVGEAFEPTGLVAVRVDGEAPPVILDDTLDASVYDGYPWQTFPELEPATRRLTST